MDPPANEVKPGLGVSIMMGYSPLPDVMEIIKRPSRYSSGVERSLGKGEVECSIHSSGTIFLVLRPVRSVRRDEFPVSLHPMLETIA